MCLTFLYQHILYAFDGYSKVIKNIILNSLHIKTIIYLEVSFLEKQGQTVHTTEVID